MSGQNAVLWYLFAQIINQQDDECNAAIEEAKSEITEANRWKKEHPVDWAMTNALSEPDDGSARITNAELTIRLAQETIVFCKGLKNTVMILGNNDDPRLLPDVYNALKQHLDNLKSEYEKIPKPSSFLGGHDLNTRGNDLIYIERHWIKEKMKMVNSLLQKIPDDDIAALRANARKEPARQAEITIDAFPPHEQLGGRRCKRTGVSGKKRGRRTNKKRKSTTRRK